MNIVWILHPKFDRFRFDNLAWMVVLKSAPDVSDTLVRSDISVVYSALYFSRVLAKTLGEYHVWSNRNLLLTPGPVKNDFSPQKINYLQNNQLIVIVFLQQSMIAIVSFGAHSGDKSNIPKILIELQKKLHFQVHGCERLPVVINA